MGSFRRSALRGLAIALALGITCYLVVRAQRDANDASPGDPADEFDLSRAALSSSKPLTIDPSKVVPKEGNWTPLKPLPGDKGIQPLFTSKFGTVPAPRSPAPEPPRK